VALTALYMAPPENAASFDHLDASMKTTRQMMPTLLLATVLGWPLMASAAGLGLDVDTAAADDRARRAPGFGGEWSGRGEPGGGERDDGHGGFRGGPFGGPPGGPGPRPFGFGPGLPPVFHGLDLSEAQQDKVFAIVHGQEPAVRELGKALRKAHEALAAIAKAAQYDDARAVAQTQALGQAVAGLELQRLRTNQKLLAVLTAEQRKQIDQRGQHEQREESGPRVPPGRPRP